MMENIILRCLQCNELFCPTQFDTYPSYNYDQESGEFTEMECDDLCEFKDAHRNHNIVKLHIIEGSFCSQYAYWNPIREDYFLASDGNEIYTIRRYRKSINKPFRYQIVDLELVFGKPNARIQEADLRDQMIIDSARYGFNKEKIRIFVRLYRSLISRIELEDLEDTGFSFENPMVSYAKLKDKVKEEFLNRCKSIFDEEEISALRRFIDENSEYNDVMNVEITRPYILKPSLNRRKVNYKDAESIPVIYKDLI
ncbi:MAG: hypothetical protein ACPL7B_04740 [Candidatus Poribacteria bacterium]